jgi:ATP/maltotriose-dependent transcriptional regulator MalT
MFMANVLAEWAAALCAVGDTQRASEAVARGRTLARPDDWADSIALDVSEAYVAALLGDRERAERLLESAAAVRGEIDMALFADWSRYVEAGVRSALGDTETARAILEGLAESAELRGYVRFAGIYRRELGALDAAGRD